MADVQAGDIDFDLLLNENFDVMIDIVLQSEQDIDVRNICDSVSFFCIHLLAKNLLNYEIDISEMFSR